MKSENNSTNLKNIEKFSNALKKLGLDSSPELIACILELQEEIEEGNLDEKTLEFISNLENSKTNKELNDVNLDSTAGGKGNGKRILAMASTLCFLLGVSAGTINVAGRTLTKDELSKTYTKDEFAQFTSEERAQITQFRIDFNKQQYYQDLEVGECGDAQIARAATIAGNEATEGLANMAKGFLPTVATIFVVKHAGDICEHLKNFYAAGSNALKNLFYKFTCKGIDIKVYETVLGRIEKRLRSELVGQDKAIDDIINIMRGYFESVVEAKALGKKFEGGLILYLTGMPATGKSTTMKIIEQEMGLTSYTGRMSDVVEDKGNGAATVAARLTKPVIEDNGKTKVTVDTPLTRQVKTGIPTLYCLDEVDKMRVQDSVLQQRSLKNEDGKIMGSSIDEMLRNFGDTGQINGINASGSILIATSNETPEQLTQLESSLYNRYKGCHIHFKDFDKQDYTEIINRKVANIKEYYKKTHNMDITLDQSIFEHYSTKFENENSGGRGVDVLMNNFRAALKNYTSSTEGFKDTTVSLNYDNQTNKLYVKKA